MSDRPKRSFLYSPASRVDRVRKAVAAGAADIVVADLEDGTAPEDRPAAREELARLLAAPPSSRTCLAVRINAWGTPEARLDAAAIAKHAPAVIVVPKVESSQALADLGQALERLRMRSLLYAQIETPRGLLAGSEIARAPRVGALVFGAEDYAASVGAVRSREGVEVLYARSHVVACAAAANVDAIDQVWVDYRDTKGLARDARFGARLGYAGKQLIHPDQIVPTHEAFTPTRPEAQRARRILQAWKEARGGVAVVDGTMIDRPLAEQARRVLVRSGDAPDAP